MNFIETAAAIFVGVFAANQVGRALNYLGKVAIRRVVQVWRGRQVDATRQYLSDRYGK